MIISKPINWGVVFFVVADIFIIVVTLMIAIKKKKLRNDPNFKRVSVKELMENSNFIMENKDKYLKRINELSEKTKKEVNYQNICINGITLLFVLLIFMGHIDKIIGISISSTVKVLLIITTLIVYLIIFFSILRNKSLGFQNREKELNELIAEMLKDYDSNLEYFPLEGYSIDEYRSLCFTEPCDRFHSSDMIVNKANDFCYADILIETVHSDEDGTPYSTEFTGSLVKTNIKNIGCSVFLDGLGRGVLIGGGFNKIKFENEEFNLLFSCYSNNELICHKIITPDIMEEFVKIEKTAIGVVDIRIIYDKLYIRFKNTNGFDSAAGIFMSITILGEIMKTVEKVKNIIQNKNIE